MRPGIQDIENLEYLHPGNPLLPVLLQQNQRIRALEGYLDKAREIIALQDEKIGRLCNEAKRLREAA